MKFFTLLLTTIIFLSAASAHAKMDAMKHNQMDHSNHPEVTQEDEKETLPLNRGDAHITVNGLVCDFCARALEKTFGKRDEVLGITVDLDKKIITVNFRSGQSLDDETLTQIITDSGYNVEGITRVE